VCSVSLKNLSLGSIHDACGASWRKLGAVTPAPRSGVRQIHHCEPERGQVQVPWLRTTTYCMEDVRLDMLVRPHGTRFFWTVLKLAPTLV